MEKRYHYITPEDYETAEQNGITAELAETRAWERGWDIDRAVTTPKRVARCFKGTWGKWKETAARHDVDRILFINRVRSLGWSEEEAATIKKGKSRTPSFWTDEERKIAKRLGIDGNGMGLPRIRMKSLGWSREKAINTPKMTEEQRVKNVAAGTRRYHGRMKELEVK